MGSLIAAGGGWKASGGYTICFFTMAICAVIGALLQLFIGKAHLRRHSDATPTGPSANAG